MTTRIHTISRKLLEGLLIYGLDVDEIAEILDTPFATVTTWLHGFCTPSESNQEKIQALADQFNVTLDNGNYRNRITKVISTAEVSGRVAAWSRLNRYADAFVIGYDVDEKGIVFDPVEHDAKVVYGLTEALNEWKMFKEKVESDGNC
jgi:transcriptional regulator with XRE-family HTH domain